MSAPHSPAFQSSVTRNTDTPPSCGCESHAANPARRQLMKSLAAAPLLVGPCAASVALAAGSPERSTDAPSLLSQFKTLASASDANIARIQPFTITPENLPWSQSLGTLEDGQQVSFFLSGQWWFVKEAGRWLEPGFVFFSRVQGPHSASPIYNTMQNTGTFTADRSGTLEIARSVGEFASPAGELWVPKAHYLAGQGEIHGVAVVWNERAQDGLLKLSAAGDVEGFLKAELQRQRLLQHMPKGWHNFFQFGDGGIYQDAPNGDIDCYTHKNVGILQYPLANQPLKPGLLLNWRWVVDHLPSDLPEDQLLNHDYLSIAVEFDDGQDITYMWSSQLPVGKVFRCPIPGWDKVETHVVQRSGVDQLGQEVADQADIHADYQRIIGGPAKRVVQVWLIANSLFMRGHGRCAYRKIRIGQQGHQQQIL